MWFSMRRRSATCNGVSAAWPRNSRPTAQPHETSWELCVYHEEGTYLMASLDWTQCPAVESIPGKVSGAWVFRDTRLPVATVIENLEDLSVEEVMEQFDVTREQIAAVLEFVAQSLRDSAPAKIPVDAHSF